MILGVEKFILRGQKIDFETKLWLKIENWWRGFQKHEFMKMGNGKMSGVALTQMPEIDKVDERPKVGLALPRWGTHVPAILPITEWRDAWHCKWSTKVSYFTNNDINFGTTIWETSKISMLRLDSETLLRKPPRMCFRLRRHSRSRRQSVPKLSRLPWVRHALWGLYGSRTRTMPEGEWKTLARARFCK